MVWGLFPVDPLPGEEKYYFFNKGTYRVGRKGCDIIINKDKGVSRIHAEILIDEMASIDNPQNQYSDLASKVRIRDCSKYGTFINKNMGSKEKVHEFPNKETFLKDGDLVSFGTGTATYRFSFVPIVFLNRCLETLEVHKSLQAKILSIGACVTQNWSIKCTHVLVDDLSPLNEDLVDAIVAKKPFVLRNWVELIAGKNVCTEIPSCSLYLPSLMLDGVSLKVVDPQSRENCLQGYTFLLESRNKYKLKDRLQTLLEVGGGNVVSVEDFCDDSQGLDKGTRQIAYVIPCGSNSSSSCARRTSSIPSVNERDLISSVLCGHLDPSVMVSPPILVASSCSTDETVVADSDVEAETATSVHVSTAVHSIEPSENDSKLMKDVHKIESNEHKSREGTVICKTESDSRSDNAIIRVNSCENREREEERPGNSSTVKSSEGSDFTRLRGKGDIKRKYEKVEGAECGVADVIYSQDLIVRDSNLPASICSSRDAGVINFKRFRKMNTPSGNSFNSLIPFSKYPYKESDYGTEEIAESLKEEKKRKQMEAIAEDLFNYEKGRRKGTGGGSLRELFARK